MRYTFSLSRRGTFAVIIGALTGTALVFSAGLLVGAAAAVPDAHLPPLAVADSAEVEPVDSAALIAAEEEVSGFDECQEPPAAVVSWDQWTGSGGQMAPLRAVDLPPEDHTGGPDPFAEDAADARTVGTFTDELQALALMHRISARGQESHIDTRMGPDGVPVFRVRTGMAEEEP
jgi:hypothetical protein